MIERKVIVSLLLAVAFVVGLSADFAQAVPVGTGVGEAGGEIDIVTANRLTDYYLRTGQFDLAAEMSQTALQTEPTNATAAKLRIIVASVIRADDKRLSELIDNLQKLGSDEVVPPIALAWLNLQRKEFDKAIEAVHKIIKENPKDPFTAINYYTLAMAHLAKQEKDEVKRRQDVDEARRWLEKSLQPDPDSPPFLAGYLSLAALMYEMNQPQQAQAYYLQAKEKDQFKQSDRINDALGQFYLLMGAGSKAYAEFKEVLDRHAGKPMDGVRFQAARALLLMGDLETAAEEFEALRASHVEGLAPQATLWLARSKAILGKFADAAKWFADYLDTSKEQAQVDAYHQLGLVYLLLQRPDDAKAQLDKIKADARMNAYIHAQWALAVYYQMKNDLPAAAKALDLAKQQIEEKARAGENTDQLNLGRHFFLAMHNIAAGNLKAANEEFKRTEGLLPNFVAIGGSDFSPNGIDLAAGFAKEPSKSASDMALAVTCYLLQWNEPAVSCSSRVITQNPKNLMARYLRANALLRQAVHTKQRDPAAYEKFMKSAEGDLAETVKINPLFAPAYMSTSLIVYALQDDPDAARKPLDDYLKQNPTDVKAVAHVGAIYQNRRDYNKALEALNLAIKLDQKNPGPKNAGLEETIGLIYLQQNKITETIQHFKQALVIDPSRDQVRAGLVSLLLNQKLYDQVIAQVPGFKDLSKFPQTCVEIATAQGHKKDYKAALATLVTLHDKYPDTAPYTIYEGLAMAATGKIKDGIALVRTIADKAAAADSPQVIEQASASTMVGVFYSIDGDLASSEKYLAQAKKLLETYLAAPQERRLGELAADNLNLTKLLRANVAVHAGDLDRALELYKEADGFIEGFNVRLLPDMKSFLQGRLKSSTFARINLAALYIRHGWHEAADDEARAVAEAEKDNFIARLVLARALQRFDIEKAVPVLKEVISLQPKLPAPHLILYDIHTKQDNADGAIDALREAIKIDETKPLYRRTLAIYLQNKRRYRDAATEYEALLKIKTEWADGYMALAECYGQLDMKAERMDSYKRMQKVVPDDPRSYNNIAWFISEESGNLDEAISQALKGVELCRKPGTDKLLLAATGDTLGWVYYQKALQEKDPAQKKTLLESAAKSLREAITLAEFRPSFVYHLCLVLEQQEEYKEARQLCQRLLKIYTSFDDRKSIEEMDKRLGEKLKSPG